MKRFITFLIAVILCISLCATANAVDIPKGAYGIIKIPYLNIEMPLYTAPYHDYDYRQKVIDEEDSALYVEWQSAYRILDHAFSLGYGGKGFWDIQKVMTGCYAYLYTQDGNYYLECYQTDKTEYHNDQEFINGRLLTPCSSHDLMLVCCAEDSHHHFVAVFRRLSELSH